MTTAATFDDLRPTCHARNREGKHGEALAAAEEARPRFPERRDLSQLPDTCTNVAMGRLAGAIAAMRRPRTASVRAP